MIQFGVISNGCSLLLVDSIYLRDIPPDSPQRVTGLLAHYLPGLELDDAPAVQAMLTGFDYLVVTSRLMAEYLGRLAPEIPVLELAPVISVPGKRKRSGREIRLLLTANLVAAKGGLPFLTRLVERGFVPPAEVRLDVIGETRLDPEYAQRCLTAVQRLNASRQWIEVCPPLSAGAYFKKFLLQADALLAPSLFETFGMAVAEALAVGTPVWATGAGNLAHLLQEAGGQGRQVAGPEALADALPDILAALREAGTQHWDDPDFSFHTNTETEMAGRWRRFRTDFLNPLLRARRR